MGINWRNIGRGSIKLDGLKWGGVKLYEPIIS